MTATSADALPKLTSAQDMMLDLLMARTRLGEPFWPVSTSMYRTYHALSDKGYVEIYGGHVNKTVRLSLTARAHKALIDDSTYVTPIERETADKIANRLQELGGDPTTIRMIRNLDMGSL